MNQLEDPSSRMTLIWNREHEKFLVSTLLDRAAKRFGSDSVKIFHRLAIAEEPAKKVAGRFNKTVGSVRVVQHRVLRFLKEIGQGILDR